METNEAIKRLMRALETAHSFDGIAREPRVAVVRVEDVEAVLVLLQAVHDIDPEIEEYWGGHRKVCFYCDGTTGDKLAHKSDCLYARIEEALGGARD